VNNLIATLPSDVHPELPNGKTADISKLTNTEPVKIRLPLRANSIGLIDGQHRLYSYYEAQEDDPKSLSSGINKISWSPVLFSLREQNLLTLNGLKRHCSCQ
jgi:hypothetical protein